MKENLGGKEEEKKEDKGEGRSKQSRRQLEEHVVKMMENAWVVN